MTKAWQLAEDAIRECGPNMTRDEFGVYAWCSIDLERAAWDIYKSIRVH